MGRKENILNRAVVEVGYLEKKSNSNLEDKTANAGSANYTKYARDYVSYMGVNLQAQAWCAMFVSWLFVQEYGLENAKKVLNGNLYASCTACRVAFGKVGRFYSYSCDPEVGDLIIFNDNIGINHIGIVEKVSDGRIYTIEGNTSSTEGVVANGGGVFRKSYAINYSRINGFCRPNYEAFPLPVPQPEPKETIEWKLTISGWMVYKNGNYVVSEWLEYKNRWYYLNEHGIMLTGVQQINGKTYYLNPDSKSGTDYGALMVTNDLNQGNLEVQIVQ